MNTSLRRFVLPLAVAVGAVAVSVPALRAGEDGASAPAPKKDHVAWLDTFAAGAAKAKQENKILFVYVGRHQPT